MPSSAEIFAEICISETESRYLLGTIFSDAGISFSGSGQAHLAPQSRCVISVVQSGANKYYTLTLAVQAANEFLYPASDYATQPMPASLDSLDLSRLTAAYRSRVAHPSEPIATVPVTFDRRGDGCVQFVRAARLGLALHAADSTGRFDSGWSLHEIPFAIKDDIGLAGQAATTACPPCRLIPDDLEEWSNIPLTPPRAR